MTEIEKVYHDDIREKKSIKNSARKTNRTGKGPVRFPSDYLTKKEKEKMNSECRSWTFKSFPDRKQFDQMPDDIKISYLNWMLNTYNVGLAAISKHVFNQASSSLRMWLRKHPDIAMYVNIPAKGFTGSPGATNKLCNDISKGREKPKAEPEPEVKITECEPLDFTPEEKDFISRYIAPISDTSAVPVSKSESEDFTMKPDISKNSIMQLSDPNAIPFSKPEPSRASIMQHMEFSLEGFDLNLIKTIAGMFSPDQKVFIQMSITAEKEI